ncbi:MAG: hypothetical protein IIB56_05725 [Planctomycetes bacterium]|nr:hypothetical protein [Planctomycetota bacterium]MCH8119658.1 hypothetical protein [Planctomycetota bacterium]
MKTNILLVILLLVNVPLCLGEINEELSRFIYALPVMEGMELVGTPENQKIQSGANIEIAIVIKVLNSKKGENISAEKISKYYYDHFVSLQFRPWQDATTLTGRYQSPDLVTKGSAYIRSQGHIRYWIPKEGNTVTFCLYQRRDFDIRQSQETIDKISKAFEAAAKEFGYIVWVPPNIMVSDWPQYLENECFVDRIHTFVRYKETNRGRGDRGDDGSYMFYFSVFPTARHAEQWRGKIVEEVEKVQRYPNWFKDGLGLSPVVIKNIVIEYKGRGGDQSAPAFRKRLMEELDKIEANKLAEGDGK